MNVQQFIKKWHKSTLKERSASQSHFNDLCALLVESTPTGVDPDGTWYTFERGAKKTGGGDGPWQVGDLEIRIAFDGEQLFEDWQHYRATDEGQRYIHELALDEINRSGILQHS